MWALPIDLDTDVVARAAAVEGYDSNSYQTQSDPQVPAVTRHPAPFTGVDASAELRFLGRGEDRTTLLVGGRVEQYEPLQGDPASADGGVHGVLGSRLTLGPRTSLALEDSAALTSFNAARATDGTVFVFDPTLLRSTYWVEDAQAALVQEIAANWRLTLAAGVLVSGTLSSQTSPGDSGPLSGAAVEHRGLDYVLPNAQVDLVHDLTPRARGDLSLLYQYAYQAFVLDLTQDPARNIGPQRTSFASALAGYTYDFAPEVSGGLRAGVVVASAPARGVDRHPIVAPSGAGEIAYHRDAFDLVAAAAFTWGTVTPRLGAGPTANASVAAVGVPSQVGAWQNFALVGALQGSYSALSTSAGPSTKLGLYAGALEARYGFARWLGVSAGYEVRYATLDAAFASPPFLQHIAYLGLSGYWSTDPSQPPIVRFAPDPRPPG